jgi:hypothetical protein
MAQIPNVPPIAKVFLLLITLITLLYFQILFFRPFIHRNGKEINGVYRLPDIFHQWFNDVSHKRLQWIAERAISTLIIGFILFFLIYDYRVLLYGLILYFGVSILLGFFHIATVLPDSKDGCCVYTGTLLETMRHRGSCNCLNVSGHLITVGLILYLFSRITPPIFIVFYVLIYMGLFFVICISRNHYTVDCLTSTVILLLLITNADVLDRWIHDISGMYLIKK